MDFVDPRFQYAALRENINVLQCAVVLGKLVRFIAP